MDPEELGQKHLGDLGGKKIQEHLNVTHQAREDFDTTTQQYHQEENPLRSMEAFTQLMRRLGFNCEAKHHNEKLGIPWEDGPIPNRHMINARFHLAKDAIEAARTCTRDPSLTATLKEKNQLHGKSYDTLCHNVERIRQKKTKEEKKN